MGRELYEDLFERLREQGVRVACAGVTLPNEASVGLHEALGFSPVGVYPKIGWKLGRVARRGLVAARAPAHRTAEPRRPRLRPPAAG